MNAFLETPPFPGCPAFEYMATPAFKSDITGLGGGAEERYRLWTFPLYHIEVTIGPRLEDETQAVLEHFMAMGGTECGFPVLNYVDYKSCRTNATPSPLDQPLEADVSSSDTYYQLVKDYKFGSRTQRRPIYKPIDGTIRVANEDGDEQTADRWTLDTTTGLLLPEPSFDGTPTTWGGEFYTPVRYEDDELPMRIVNKSGGGDWIQTTSFALKELRKSDLGF